jgi:hypothetical protein
MKTNIRRVVAIAATVLGTLATIAVAERKDSERMTRGEIAPVSAAAALIASAPLTINHCLRRRWA